jgi:CRISPR-associated protein Cmr2
LQETLVLAREAEKIAKKEVPNRKQPEKNALAITLSKRSGVERTVKGSWNKSNRRGALDSRLYRFVFLLFQDQLPDGVAYELQDLALRLKAPKDPNDADRSILLEAQQAEAKRILRRKRPMQETISAKILDDFCGVKKKNGMPARSGYLDLIDLDDWTLESLAEELIIARELARAIEQAGTMEDWAIRHGFIERKEKSADDA